MARKGGKTAFLRGRRARLTRVDRSGRPVVGEDSVSVTKGFITIGYTTNTEEGEAVTRTNAAGETCISEPATPTFNGFSVEIEFCDVDFGTFNLVTGQDVYLSPTGDVIGLTESTDVDLTAVNFALELWLGAQTDATPSEGGQGHYGYVVTPFLGGGVIGDVTVENDAITFTVTNMSTRDGTNWGRGPYHVELNASGEPDFMREPMRARDHRRWILTEVAPPEPTYGVRPLLDSSDAPLTAITAEATGLSVNIDPVPTGTDPVWYDLGDGQWDYSETGAYAHTYEQPGTYRIVGYRGATSASTEVTVSA